MRKLALLVVLVGTACVDVPRAIRNDFAEPRPHERSNFRKGPHGEKPEVAAEAGVDGGEGDGGEDAPGSPAGEEGGAS